MEFYQLCENNCVKKSKSNQQYCTVLLGHKHTPTRSAHSWLHTPTVIFQDLSQSQQIHFLEQQSFNYGNQSGLPLCLNLSEQPYHMKRKEKEKNKTKKPSQKHNIGLYEAIFQNSSGKRKTTYKIKFEEKKNQKTTLFKKKPFKNSI